jgi:hypothetical protein
MKFYKSGLASVVWDAERNCVLARFEDGEFTTDDKRTQELLKGYGYESAGEEGPQVTDRVRPTVTKRTTKKSK